ncbi:LOW QUALITY PROTEIN: hypothetical protein HZS_3906 [Henneguya salminicola]|nr:LOW QUALITY PROTEIN: hypothetical protein HZS_3906 [Henneguya salminicola]
MICKNLSFCWPLVLADVYQPIILADFLSTNDILLKIITNSCNWIFIVYKFSQRKPYYGVTPFISTLGNTVFRHAKRLSRKKGNIAKTELQKKGLIWQLYDNPTIHKLLHCK